MSAWPSSHDYTVAIQGPHLCFRDADLKASAVARTRLTGMPRVWTGNFAQVYEMSGASQRWAVKCFTRSAADLRTRYARIAAAIAAANLPYFVEFRLLEDEMLVGGRRYPVVKMAWLEGQPLDAFVEANLHKPPALLDTAERLLRLVHDLETRCLAHGDLQHGNILVTPGGLKLVDYDGLFVPAFSGTPAPEVGLPAYQHPERTAKDYGVGLDRFALLVICTGLAALAADPSLWHEFNTGDNLLFTSADFRKPRASRLLQKLDALPDPQVRTLARALTEACGRSPLRVPLLEGPLAKTAVPRHRFWWVDSSGAGTGASPAGGSRPRRRVRSRLSAGQHPGWTAVVVGALAIAAAASQLGPEAGLWLGGCGTLGFLVERFTRYRALPAVKRRRRLRARAQRLRTLLATQQRRLSATERRLAALPATGNRESARRRKLTTDVASVGARVASTAETMGEVEWQVTQVRAPGFFQYLRQSF